MNPNHFELLHANRCEIAINFRNKELSEKGRACKQYLMIIASSVIVSPVSLGNYRMKGE